MTERSAAWMGFLLMSVIAISAHLAEAVTGIQASFELPQLRGNPFDCIENDVEVTLAEPGGKHVTLPAFYDGGTTWRVRHTPSAVGKYSIESILLNGKDAHPQQVSEREFNITAPAGRGFIRIDPNHPMRFAFDDGSIYYPVGYDMAWHQDGKTPMPPLTESLGRMGNARVNWTRIWMNYWDGKNLDWAAKGEAQPPLGQLSLTVAKRWDDIIDAAATHGVYVQMVLQHHGQYTTHNDTNWAINPWNKANGGWLSSPVEFFTDEKAKSLTKAKFRYIVARWGYSPAIMGWELFNEVESTDAFRTNVELVAAWHEEMAGYLRQVDSYKHLITTSSHTSEPGLWRATDYYQAHTYPSDIFAAIADLDSQQLKRPYFYGEFGGPNADAEADPPKVLHQGLWASLMSQSSGAAQYWFWYLVEPEGLLNQFTSVQKFIDLSGVSSLQSSGDFQVAVRTKELAPLKIGPGIDWAPSRSTHFTISRNGRSDDVSGMSAFLQGQSANRPMFPSATFDVDYPSAGEFSVHADQITQEGAKLELSIDGHPAASIAFAGTTPGASTRRRNSQAEGRVDSTLTIPVPAGQHAILMNNSGGDWIHIHDLTLTPYTAGLGVLGKGNNQACVLWIYRRDQTTPMPIAGSLSLPNMKPGAYRIVWWDTFKGQVIKEESESTKPTIGLQLETPPIDADSALFIERSDASH